MNIMVQPAAQPAICTDKILIAEDDPGVRELVAEVLEDEGYAVVAVDTAAEARRQLCAHDFALVLVDLRLADGDGLGLVREISDTGECAVVILSGKSSPVDRVVGIEIGADDYVTKPFDNRELVARVKRHISRTRALRISAAREQALAPVRLGCWTVDPARRIVVSDAGEAAPVSEAEFRTLLCLLRHRGEVMSRDAIHREVVGPAERDPLDRRIDVHISNLRKKLRLNGDCTIRTVHRVGYIID